MKFLAGIGISEGRGSVGGQVFSRNRYGAYIRSKVSPVQPGSAPQLAVRNYFQIITNRWTNILTAGQRLAWKTYADAVPVMDTLGQTQYLDGHAMYVRCNLPRAYATSDVGYIVDTAPTELTNIAAPELDSLTARVMNAGGTTVEFNCYNADAPAATPGSLVVCYLSGVIGTGINYFKGPFLLHGYQEDDIPANQPTVYNVLNATPMLPDAAGLKVCVEVLFSNPDGRLSARTRLYGVTSQEA